MLVAAGAVRFGGDSLPRTICSLMGTAGSSIFLLLIAVFNLGIFVALWRTMRAAHEHGTVDAEKVEVLLAGRGCLSRWLAPMFRTVTKSWHMYPVGLLFGLGFDTATEIGLLSMSAAEVARGVSLSHVLVFPALFAADMALADTVDSTLMVNVYRWAFVDPLRKLRYNLTITGASVVVAVFMGGVEALSLIGDHFGLSGGPWTIMESLGGWLTNFGFMVIGLFVIGWLVSIASYRAAFAGRRWPRSFSRR
jgi:high-affinity nickel-transport protein